MIVYPKILLCICELLNNIIAKKSSYSPQGSWLMTVMLLRLTHAALLRSQRFRYVTWSLPHTPSKRPVCVCGDYVVIAIFNVI